MCVIVIFMAQFTTRSAYKAVVTITIRLRFDRPSTPIRLQFDRATTIGRPRDHRATALRPKYINRSASLSLAGQRPVLRHCDLYDP